MLRQSSQPLQSSDAHDTADSNDIIEILNADGTIETIRANEDDIAALMALDAHMESQAQDPITYSLENDQRLATIVYVLETYTEDTDTTLQSFEIMRELAQLIIDPIKQYQDSLKHDAATQDKITQRFIKAFLRFTEIYDSYELLQQSAQINYLVSMLTESMMHTVMLEENKIQTPNIKKNLTLLSTFFESRYHSSSSASSFATAVKPSDDNRSEYAELDISTHSSLDLGSNPADDLLDVSDNGNESSSYSTLSSYSEDNASANSDSSFSESDVSDSAVNSISSSPRI